MFLKALKRKSAKKFLHQVALTPKSNRSFDVKAVKKVACLVDLNAFNRPEQLNSFCEVFGLESSNFHLLGYEQPGDASIAYFTPDGLQWKGVYKQEEVNLFLGNTYDILINYFQEPKVPILAVSARVDANIRLGFDGIGAKFNDIHFKGELKEMAAFQKEMMKYLQVIR